MEECKVEWIARKCIPLETSKPCPLINSLGTHSPIYRLLIPSSWCRLKHRQYYFKCSEFSSRFSKCGKWDSLPKCSNCNSSFNVFTNCMSCSSSDKCNPSFKIKILTSWDFCSSKGNKRKPIELQWKLWQKQHCTVLMGFLQCLGFRQWHQVRVLWGIHREETLAWLIYPGTLSQLNQLTWGHQLFLNQYQCATYIPQGDI